MIQCVRFLPLAAAIVLALPIHVPVLAQPSKPLSPDQAAFVKVAKQNVVRDFKDPASAQYRGVFIARKGAMTMLCGEVNSKNSYGGYVGFRAFVAQTDATMTMVGGGDFPTDLVQASKTALCNEKIADVE